MGTEEGGGREDDGRVGEGKLGKRGGDGGSGKGLNGLERKE